MLLIDPNHTTPDVRASDVLVIGKYPGLFQLEIFNLDYKVNEIICSYLSTLKL
jgi:hypothetical protein